MPDNTTSVHATRDESGTALLIIDMVSCWSFPDADKVLAAAEDVTPRIVALKARCKDAGVPVIYANDNDGRWRSDWQALMHDALDAGGAGARIATQLTPSGDDYFVLKPMHSAFFSTPLHLLLQHLKVRRVVLTGVTSDQCVLGTASDAKMRGYEVCVPCDAVATQTPERAQAALLHFQDVMRLPTPRAEDLRLS